MSDLHKYQENTKDQRNWWFTFPGIVCVVILGVILFTLIVDHRKHLVDNWILLLFLLCPTLHLLMHRKHDHSHPSTDKEDE